LRRADLILLAFGLTLGTGGAVKAQGVVVFDQSAIASAQQTLLALKQQLDQLKTLVGTAQNLAGAVGQAGVPALPFQTSLSQNGLTAFSAQLTAGLTGGGPSGGNSALQPVLAQIAQAKSVSTTAPGDPSDFAGLQQWVGNALTNSPTDDATAKSLGRQARSLVAGEAAADGYALALTARQQVATRLNQAQNLAGQIAASTTLRDDIAANSAVMLAIHDEMAEIQGLLAASLAVQSSDQMATGDGSAPSSAQTSTQTSAQTSAQAPTAAGSP